MVSLKIWIKVILDRRKPINIFCSLVLYHHSLADIQKTLDSLVSTHIIEKIILVDNGGCDWANQLESSKIYYIKAEKNGGFGYGHNLAIKKYAHMSDFFLICNPDIVFDSQDFDRMYEIIKTQEYGAFSPRIIYPNGNDQFGQRLLPTPMNLIARRFFPSIISDYLDKKYLLQDCVITKPLSVSNISGSFMLFKSECLINLKGFDERYFMYMEDIDLSRRCAKEFGILYIPEITVIHEHQRASYHSKDMVKAHIQSAIKYFNKWGWIFDRERKEMNAKVLTDIKY